MMPKELIEQLRQLDAQALIKEDLDTFCKQLIDLGLFQDELSIKLFILDFLPKAIQSHGAGLPVEYEECKSLA